MILLSLIVPPAMVTLASLPLASTTPALLSSRYVLVTSEPRAQRDAAPSLVTTLPVAFLPRRTRHASPPLKGHRAAWLDLHEVVDAAFFKREEVAILVNCADGDVLVRRDGEGFAELHVFLELNYIARLGRVDGLLQGEAVRGHGVSHRAERGQRVGELRAGGQGSDELHVVRAVVNLDPLHALRKTEASSSVMPEPM